MTGPTLAHHLVALNTSGGQVPSDIHLLPRGTFHGRDGRGPYKVPDPAKVIAATQAHQKGAKLPVDFDHQLEYYTKGDTVRAAGWIDGLRADDDGLHGRVEWSPKAAQMIADREYRYVSPVFHHTQSGDVVRLSSVSLVNQPNLDLISLNAERATMPPSDPHALLRLLQDQLGLPEEADAETVVAATSEALDITAANASAAPSPLEWVPIGEYRRVCQELSALDNRMSEQAAEHHVKALVANGQLFPFQKEWAVSVCRADKDALDKFVAEVGPQTRAIFDTMSTPLITGPAPPGKSIMDDDRRAVAEAMGLDPATMRTVPKRNWPWPL
jgi:phage I-like protein